MAWGPIIGGALAAGGAIWSALSAKKEAQKNRDFQERMSSTAHQREMADMKAAGLNPMFAFGGASSPGGSQAQTPDMGRGLSDAVASALAVKQGNANVELTKATTAKTMKEAEFLDESFQMRMREQGAKTDYSELSMFQLRDTLKTLVKQEQVRLQEMTSSAKKVEAEAVLAQLARTGAANAEEVERVLGSKGKGAKAILEILRLMRSK